MVNPSPEQYFRRRRRRMVVSWVVGLSILTMVAVADHRGWLLYGGDLMRRYDGRRYSVTAVLDSATVQIAEAGHKHSTLVKLLGVQAAPLPEATTSLEGLRNLVVGRQVKLFLEPNCLRGPGGQLLAVVELPDGSLLNERVLREGLARVDSSVACVNGRRHAMLELQAQRDQMGLWSRNP